MQTMVYSNSRHCAPANFIPRLSDLTDMDNLELPKEENKLIKPIHFIYSLSPFQPVKDIIQNGTNKHDLNKDIIFEEDIEDKPVPPLKLKEYGSGDSQVLLIRHGSSVFNIISTKFADATGFTFKDREAIFNFDRKVLDTQLHVSGKQQAQLLGKQIAGVQIHTVLVSPLKRTLQTCYNVFKDHPMKNQIKFIVFPLVSEIYSKNCDVFDSEHTFQDPYLQEFFDFSTVDQLWQVENIQDEELKKQIYSSLKFDPTTGKCINLEQVMMQHVDQNFPKSVEKYKSVYERGVKAKNFVRDYIKKNNLSKKQKVVIISHNSYIRNLTASGPDDGKSGMGGLKFSNCEAGLYNF